MRALTIVHSSLFAAGVIGVAMAAFLRVVPVQLPEDRAWLDGRATKAFESQYDERFPVRTLGTNLWAAIDYVLFAEGRPGVVVGSDDWLYTDEEFRTYADADATVATHLALLPWVRDELARHGTQLVVALVPSKARIYPEHLGARRPAALHEGLYARTLDALHAAGIAAPDLVQVMEACKREQPAYLRTDTHWTPAGARCAADAVRATLAADGTAAAPPGARYRTRTLAAEQHRGDLLGFLPLDPYFAALLPPREPIERRVTERVDDGAAEGLLDETGPPPVVLVGTSYSADERWNLTGALQDAFQEDVVSYAAKGKGPFEPMLNYLLHADALPGAPHLLVWEIPERYLPIAQDLHAARDAPAPVACATGADPDTTL